MRIGADVNVQAMQALSTDMAVRANNVANVSTEGFQPSALGLESGPEDQGVRVSHIYRSTEPGPLVLMNNKFVQGATAMSGTDLATEMVGMMRTQTAFAANAAMVRAWDETTGLLVNMKV